MNSLLLNVLSRPRETGVIHRLQMANPGGTRGHLAVGHSRLPCVIGRSGLTAIKREGDGATPSYGMMVLGGFCRGDRASTRNLPRWLVRLDGERDRHLGWCDAPGHRLYNHACRLPHEASAETLIRNDRLYDVVVILDWNIAPRARGRGSAIFAHLMREDQAPTEGCIALSPRGMARLLGVMRPGDVIATDPTRVRRVSRSA